MKFQTFKKFLVSVLSAAMILTAIPADGIASVRAAEEKGTLTSVESVTAEGNVATITFNGEIKAKLTFLEDGIFRYNVDPSGEFSEYAKVRAGYPDTARIQQYPDYSDKYSHPTVKAVKKSDGWEITGGDTTIIFDQNAKMTVKSGDKTVMQEKVSLKLGNNSTVQTLVEQNGEQFFGGGTQNGRFVHTGKEINIRNESGWNDGQISSPNPFYYSTAGYGVLRNTWQNGKYNFGAAAADTVTASHEENEFDAYYFVSDAANNAAVTQELLQEYFKVTGNPVLLPEYGFYLGNLNAYNRDAWSAEARQGYGAWNIKGNASHDSAGTTIYERGGTGTGIASGEIIETLNGKLPANTGNMPENVTADRQFSAQAVLDRYLEYDMPFGFLLPNDGYGSGYGHHGFNVTGGVTDGQSSPERLAAVEANVENLKEFADYAKSKGVATGLWTQSDLKPDANPNTKWHLLRDFRAEVAAGVTTLKTDVAWVGPGYSFQLSGVKDAYDTVTEVAKTRPNIISVDGWAGSQRFNSVWTGDQYGGNWEYIRFHIPTFIGQSLSGNPNVGSDMDGIFGGDTLIATRDYQWKSFAPQMLDMDGWGRYVKSPFVHGDPYTGVSRMYLKLKAMMMPYIYTNAYAAANIDTGNGDQGLPMVRAMFLEFPEEAEAYGNLAKYQYMWGENLLVAPVYKDEQADELGNDIRNGIYLPGGNEQIWIDYFTGEQYRGGQVLNGFEAPLWKMPLFVKNGAIIPMYAEHNVVSSNAEKGLDKSKRIIEFWPDGTSDFTAIEDDGSSISNHMDSSDAAYGVIDEVDYGNRMSTKYTSVVDKAAKRATLTANAATGLPYDGYTAQKDTTFIVHASKKPSEVKAMNGDAALTVTEVASKEAFDAATATDSAVYFYDAAPKIETFASAEETIFADMVKDVKVSGKLYVKFPKTNLKQELVVEGFENTGNLIKNELNENLDAPTLRVNEEATTPTSIRLEWDAVTASGNKEAADHYEIEVDHAKVPFMVKKGETFFEHNELEFKSTHSYRIRSVNQNGYSAWSAVFKATSKDDPFLNTPVPESVQWTGDVWAGRAPERAFDRVFQTGDNGFHSDNGGINEHLTVDYGNAYIFDKIEYYPRDDAGNGTVSKMRVETSLDGVHWIAHGNAQEANGGKVFEFPQNADMKTLELSDPNTNDPAIGARYIRFTALASAGGFFTASEIKPYAVTGTNTFGSVWKPFKVGNIKRSGTAEATLTQFNAMYLQESRLHQSAKFEEWVENVQKEYGDINFNGISDVYDYAFTAFDVDGGTKQTGSVRGNATLEPSSTTIKAGETFTVSVKANDIKNLNAYGTIIHYNPAKVEYVSSAYTNVGQMHTEGMSAAVKYDDGTAYIHHSALNMGDKPLVNSSDVLSVITLRAVQDITLNDIQDVQDENFIIDLSTVTIMGPDFSYIDCVKGSEDETIYFAQKDFNITLTNELLPADPTDGVANVEKLIQQKNYNSLFDGSTSDRGFELKWDHESNYDPDTGKLPAYVKLPLTMHLDLKENALVDQVAVYNANKANGYLTSAKAQLVYADGTSSEEVTISQEQAVYEFNFTPEKNVDRIDVTFLKAVNASNQEVNNMLTLAEIEVRGRAAITEPDVPEINKEALNAAITDAEALKSEDYTAETWNALQTALTEARRVAALADTTQEAVNKATADLRTAISNLLPAGSETGEFVYKQEAFRLTMTNELLPEDPTDGVANVEKLIQQSNYNGLFNGTKEAVATNRDFELKWDYEPNYDPETGALPPYITLPITLHMEMKEAGIVDQVAVYNANKGNGYLNRAKVTFHYTEGEPQSVLISEEQAVYEFANPLVDQMVTKIDVEFLSSTSGERNLTLAEIEVTGHENAAPQVDKAELNKAIADAEALVEAAYTPDSWKAVADALKAAKDLANAENVTQAEVDDAAKALTDAMGLLVAKADKQKLNEAIEEAGKLVEDRYTAESWKTVADALKEAKAAAADENIDQPTVDAKEKALTDAIANLVLVEIPEKVDKQALQKAINDAEGLTKTDYTAESWKEVEDALKAAKETAADENASQTTVDSRTKALTDAIKNLKVVESNTQADKTELNKVIVEAEKRKEADYTAESWKVFVNALRAAKETAADKNADQATVDAKAKALTEAMASLKKAEKPSGGSGNGSSQQPDNTGNAGNGSVQAGTSAKTGDPAQTVTFVTLLLFAAAAVLMLRRKSKLTK